MKRKAKIVVPLLVIGMIGAGVWWRLNRRTDASDDILRLYGNVEIRDAQLSFPEQERISDILVEEGDRVTAGQVLARQRTDRLNAEIDQAKAQINAQQEVVDQLVEGTRKEEIAQIKAEVEAAKVRYQNAKQIFDRIKRTAAAGATSRQALDNARTEFEVAQAELHVKERALDLAEKGPRQEEINRAKAILKGQKANLALLQIRLNDRVMTAPSPGVIQSRIMEPGEMAIPGRPVLTLALMDPKWVRAYVPEPDLGRIRHGESAKVVSDSFAGQSFEGTIGFISPVAEFTPKNVETVDLRTNLVYEVRVVVEDPQNRLRLGMPVTVKVETGPASAKSES